jgi:hypothetical protein
MVVTDVFQKNEINLYKEICSNRGSIWQDKWFKKPRGYLWASVIWAFILELLKNDWNS